MTECPCGRRLSGHETLAIGGKGGKAGVCQSCLDFWERVGQLESVIGSSRAERLAVGWAPRLRRGGWPGTLRPGGTPSAHLSPPPHHPHHSPEGTAVEPTCRDQDSITRKILETCQIRPRWARAMSPLPPMTTTMVVVSGLTEVFGVARRCRPVPSQFSKPTVLGETSVIATLNRLACQVGPVGCSISNRQPWLRPGRSSSAFHPLRR